MSDFPILSTSLSPFSTNSSRKDKSTWDVNSGVYTRVHLRVKAETRFGEEIHVSGSSLALGQFNPHESTCLVTTPEEYPVWYTLKPLILPRGVEHHYMYAIFSGNKFREWESIPCDRLLIPECQEMIVEEEYGQHDPNLGLIQVKEGVRVSGESKSGVEKIEKREGEKEEKEKVKVRNEDNGEEIRRESKNNSNKKEKENENKGEEKGTEQGKEKKLSNKDSREPRENGENKEQIKEQEQIEQEKNKNKMNISINTITTSGKGIFIRTKRTSEGNEPNPLANPIPNTNTNENTNPINNQNKQLKQELLTTTTRTKIYKPPLLRSQSGYRRYTSSGSRPFPNTRLLIVCYHLPIILTRNTEASNSDDVRNEWKVRWNSDSLIAKKSEEISENVTVKWVGCVTSIENKNDKDFTESDIKEISSLLSAMDCVPVFLDSSIADGHYQGYCKSILWPMFHNVDIMDVTLSSWESNEIDEQEEQIRWWQCYQYVNREFAKIVTQMYSSQDSSAKDTIWVHDYHLLLLPSYIIEELCYLEMEKRNKDFIKPKNILYSSKRENDRLLLLDNESHDHWRKKAFYTAKKHIKRPWMVFFLHVPFPTSEIFRELMNGTQLLEGVLDVNVIGFHCFEHARHFLNACKRFLGLSYQSRFGGNLGVNYHGRNVVITISHVGIEKQYISDCLKRGDVIQKCKEMKKKYDGKHIICGFDEYQRLSGITLKLLAYEQFLAQFPVWKDKVVLVQVMARTSSREREEEYMKAEVYQLVERIQKRYDTQVIDIVEVSSLPLFLDRLPLWLAADILLMTSIRSGLNLKPLEYMYAKEDNPGVVILSEFSACCCVLNGALRINPWNLTEVTNAIDHALTMDIKEKHGRRARDLPYITMQPASNWTRQVLSLLFEVTNEEAEEKEDITDLEQINISQNHMFRTGETSDFKQVNIGKIVNAYKNTKRRLFLLDYGGTLIARENMSMYIKKDFTAVTGKIPSANMMRALENLCNDPLNSVFVISGVSQVNLGQVLGHITNLGLAAENGAIYSWAEAMNYSGKDPSAEQQMEQKCREVFDNVNVQHDTGKNECVRRYHSMGDQVGKPDSLTGSPQVEKCKAKRHWYKKKLDYDWSKIRERVDPVLKTYTVRTNGSLLRYSEQCISWNYRSTDPDWGLMQANTLHAHLEEIVRDLPVVIVRKKGLLEIVPEGLSKGVVTHHILDQDAYIHQSNPDFIFCIGDDSTDEYMFQSVYDYYAEGNIVEERPLYMYTCTVGKKPTQAHLYVNEVDDVEELLKALGDASIDNSVGGSIP